ncbi:oxygen-independent coproporphyrinogen III oxidase [Pseudooctadecabacter jejudonensis]|uniref:Coproporphyrinogen-III oxidase n=1 Tax=Pseudooctadecabacter jejudonensis TaxID=1391910 RepID=A0A1Y5SUF4_9RHOB|nr:oxygen-independent coproporphyrinogen III oxidase [Pseudooctadecabacter jejudonensis]SLN48587.1 Oxygen-independent coproporphyrinogen-III oxidase [Pseudooctadecabacter jejudonensis]
MNLFRSLGLFDAKVPRYTSYPPANRFEADVGARRQRGWLGEVRGDAPVSLYAHIPFCRRLCWFCACRTQGTKTLSPVAGYVKTLMSEIEATARVLPRGVAASRLHLGGGTPTLLSAEMMATLLDSITGHFGRAEDYEFSVEIDPTEAAPATLDCLARYGMDRASIGVQDFDDRVQKAIGREQGFEVTQDVVAQLRTGGVQSLNIDFLYGLPFQTAESLTRTIDQVASLRPDRLALYGYAHVPHVSKRQTMIPGEALPSAEARFEMSQIAKDRLEALGYLPLGIDHFALPHDSLAKAAASGRMQRNFQGYTDDPCDTLIGFGASAISKFPQGYAQNAVSTSAYVQRVEQGGLAAHKGLVLSDHDRFVARLIDMIMCDGRVSVARVLTDFPDHGEDLVQIIGRLMTLFAGAVAYDGDVLHLNDDMRPLTRLIAAQMDCTAQGAFVHSLAV